MNIQDRMELLKLLSETVQDTIRGGWMERVNFHEEDFRIRWQADGTGIVEQISVFGRSREILRFQVEVTCSVVEPAPTTNTPTGFVVHKPWKSIPAGWFVTPGGRTPQWFEVLATTRHGSIQRVRLRMADGTPREFDYDPDVRVQCRRGSLAVSSVEHALEVLGEGAEILADPAPEESS